MSRMTKTLTLRDANQTFARCIREVEAGEEIIITRNGTPVARISPVNQRRVLTPKQQAAFDRLNVAMETGWDIGRVRSTVTRCMSDDAFTLDTNILVYSVDRNAGPRHELAKWIVRRAGFTSCHLTLQAVSEFYAVVTRKRMMPPPAAAQVARDLIELFRTVAVSASAVEFGPDDRGQRTRLVLGRAPGGDRRRSRVLDHPDRRPRGWNPPAWHDGAQSVRRHRADAGGVGVAGPGLTPRLTCAAVQPASLHATPAVKPPACRA